MLSVSLNFSESRTRIELFSSNVIDTAIFSAILNFLNLNFFLWLLFLFTSQIIHMSAKNQDALEMKYF